MYLFLTTTIIFAALFIWATIRNASAAAEQEHLAEQIGDLSDFVSRLQSFHASYTITDADLINRPENVKTKARSRMLHVIAEDLFKALHVDQTTDAEGRTVYRIAILVRKDDRYNWEDKA